MAAGEARRDIDPRVPRARKLRRQMTDAERILWWHLRRIPVEHSHFRRQATVGAYFADFACHEQRLIIEVDGGQHNRPENALADAERTEYLKSQDYRVLRFWNNDVLKNIDGVMESICAALHGGEAVPPPLTPPHRASRGGRGTERPQPVANTTAAPKPVADNIAAAKSSITDAEADSAAASDRIRKNPP